MSQGTMRADSISPLVRMRGITKVFAGNGVVANESVDFELLPGEIHALVGENGSGKSTLMHVLSGMLRPDAGEIEMNGVSRQFHSPHEALAAGIGMVHQHVQVVREFTVLENIILGREPRTRFGRIDWDRASRRVEELMDEYNLHLHPDQPAVNLSVDGLQKTTLLSLLYAEARTIILDEPMTLFDENERDTLQAVLKRLNDQGCSLVLITHKLKEALTYSDRVSVMRGGRRVGTFSSADLTREGLSKLMIGGSGVQSPGPVSSLRPSTAPPRGSEVLLELIKIGYKGRQLPPLRDVSFHLHRGEIVAVTGIRENGLETLEQILGGFTAPTSGTVMYKGAPITGASIRQLRRKRIAYIPTERLVRGSSMDSSVADNMIILNYRDFHSWGKLKREEIEHFSRSLRQQYNIKGSSADKLSRLSGGNIQKVIISRELNTRPELVIFSEPSWGLDIPGRQFVLDKIREIKGQGSAILVITSDIDEALECADRIVIMYRGEISSIVYRDEVDKLDIGRLMLGVKKDA